LNPRTKSSGDQFCVKAPSIRDTASSRRLLVFLLDSLLLDISEYDNVVASLFSYFILFTSVVFGSMYVIVSNVP
jgi:hypothetical protein